MKNVTKNWAQSTQPKFVSRGLKVSWFQMDRDWSGRSRSTPLAFALIKIEDAGSL